MMDPIIDARIQADNIRLWRLAQRTLPFIQQVPGIMKSISYDDRKIDDIIRMADRFLPKMITDDESGFSEVDQILMLSIISAVMRARPALEDPRKRKLTIAAFVAMGRFFVTISKALDVRLDGVPIEQTLATDQEVSYVHTAITSPGT